MLMFLYPFAMALIVLSVASPLVKHDPVVYFLTVVFTIVSAFLDMVVSFPPVVSQSTFGLTLASFQQSFLPFASLGLDRLVPALVGAVLGLAVHLLHPVLISKTNTSSNR